MMCLSHFKGETECFSGFRLGKVSCRFLISSTRSSTCRRARSPLTRYSTFPDCRFLFVIIDSLALANAKCHEDEKAPLSLEHVSSRHDMRMMQDVCVDDAERKAIGGMRRLLCRNGQT